MRKSNLHQLRKLKNQILLPFVLENDFCFNVLRIGAVQKNYFSNSEPVVSHFVANFYIL